MTLVQYGRWQSSSNVLVRPRGDSLILHAHLIGNASKMSKRWWHLLSLSLSLSFMATACLGAQNNLIGHYWCYRCCSNQIIGLWRAPLSHRRARWWITVKVITRLRFIGSLYGNARMSVCRDACVCVCVWEGVILEVWEYYPLVNNIQACSSETKIIIAHKVHYAVTLATTCKHIYL